MCNDVTRRAFETRIDAIQALHNDGLLEYAIEQTRSKLFLDLAEHVVAGRTYGLVVQEKTSIDQRSETRLMQFSYELRPAKTNSLEVCELVHTKVAYIKAINCKNCGAPIPVGRISSLGAVVECAYCGTNHAIKLDSKE